MAAGVCLGLLALSATIAASAPYHLDNALPGKENASSSVPLGGSKDLPLAVDHRNASLLVPTGVIPEGQPFRVDVVVTGVDCTASAPDNESLSYFSIRFGDGYTWNLNEGVVSVACDHLNLTMYFSTTYAYHSMGNFAVDGQAYWVDGTNRSVEASVEVGPPSMTTIYLAEVWIGAMGAAIGAVALATFVMRKLARPPPELPFEKV